MTGKIGRAEVAKARRNGRVFGGTCLFGAILGLLTMIRHPPPSVIFFLSLIGTAALLYGVWLTLIYGRKLLREVERSVLEREKRRDDWINANSQDERTPPS